MPNFKNIASKKFWEKIRLAVGVTLAAIFLLQSINAVSIIPIKSALELLGVSSDPLKIIFFVIFSYVLLFLAIPIFHILSIIGVQKELKTKIVGNLVVKGFMGFVILFISLMSFAVLFGGFGNIFEGAKTVQFLNWYLFWSFLVNSFVKPEFVPLDKKEGI